MKKNIFNWVPPGQRNKQKPVVEAEPVAEGEGFGDRPKPKPKPPGKPQEGMKWDQYLGIYIGVGGGHSTVTSGTPGGGGGSGPLPGAQHSMLADTGQFTFGPNTALSRQNQTLAAGTGVFTMSGKPATLLYHQTPTARVLGAGVGQFTVNGQDVTLSHPLASVFSLGVNLAGLDFGGSNLLAPTTADVDYWYARGCRRFRLPCRWEKIQPTLNAALDPACLAVLDGLIDYAIGLGMKVLLDIHSFGAFNGTRLGTGAVTQAAFNDLWSRLASHYVGRDSTKLTYDLMNEPFALPAGETTWVAFAKGAIATIHAIDPNKTIYVEGYFFASTWSWLANNPTLHTVRDAAPTHPIVISGHIYFDHNNEGANFDWDTEAATPGGAPPGTNTNVNIGVQRTTDFFDWLVAHNYRGHLGEVGAPASWDNPRPTNDINWQTTLVNLLNVCVTKGIEVDAWAAGPFWGNYPQSLAPYGGRQSRTVPTLQTYWGTRLTVNPTEYFVDGPHRGAAGVASSNFTVDYRGHLNSTVTITPHSTAGGTWTPATRTLSGDNPTATFTLTIATEQVSQITFTNDGGLTDPATTIYTTQPDDFGTVEASLQNVFSYQRKVATYIGPCLRLRRSSDNAESDFNFTSNAMYAYLDTAAIATWAGADTMYLVKWYNQSNITNPTGHMLPPYTDSSAGAGTLADQPTFVLNAGDGYPAAVFYASRMDCESPLELVTGQVIITNNSYTFGQELLGWSFTGFYDLWGPGWWLIPGDGTTNIYNVKGDFLEMPGPQEYDEFHVNSGSWTGGAGTVGACRTWRDNILVGVGDVGADRLCVDYHRNTCNVGYRRFGGLVWYGKLRDVTILNGPVAEDLVKTMAGRDITKYATDYAQTQQTPDIDLNFAANTYTVDGGASSMAANVTASPTRDSSGLICDGTQTYLAQGPLLTALQGDDFTIQIDTDLARDANTGYETLFYLATAANAKFVQFGWEWFSGQWGTYAAVALAGLGSENYYRPGGTGYYSDSATGGSYRHAERRHILSQKKATSFNICQEGETDYATSTNSPNWLTAQIGWWPQGTWSSVKFVGRVKRIRVWRKNLTRMQRLFACENAGTKGAVPSPFLMGVNLAGGEFNGTPFYPSAAEADYYANKAGFKIARVPFKWERLQTTLNGPLDGAALPALKTVVANNHAQGIITVLDCHNYATYFDVASNTQKSLGDGSLTTANFVDMWTRVAQVAEFNHDYVWFGLQNEPVNDSRAPSAWFTSCAAMTAGIRAYNTVSIIAVPGNHRFTAAAAWSSDHGDAYLANYTDSANKSIFEVHGYFDSDLSGTHNPAVEGAARYEFMNCIRWGRRNGVRFLVGECGCESNPANGFAARELHEAMRLLRNADDVCAAFTYWAGGRAWGAYPYTLEPYRAGILNDGFADPRGDRMQLGILRNWTPNPYENANTTYYVDTAGSDSNDGLSTTSPWQTIAKVNASTFGPGSKVLFKGGQTFSGNLLTPSGGIAGSPVTYGSYGTGKATINGGNSWAIFTYNQAHVVIRDLIAVGSGITTNSGHAGILAGNDLAGNVKLAGISIKNCEASGFGARGIAIGGWVGTSGYSGALIEDCIAYNNSGHAGENGSSGIIVYGQTQGSVSHTDLVIRRCQAYGNTGTATGAGGWTGSGIVAGQCSNALITDCIAHDNGVNSVTSAGPVGIWFWDCTDSTIQYCESYDNKTGSHTDGGGFDLDGGCINCTVQYCYSHGNYGPGFLMFKYAGLGWDNNTFRYNVSENDGTDTANPLAAGIGIQSNSGALTNVKIYGNTVYQNVSTAARCIAFGGNQSSSGTIANNIFMTGSNGAYILYAPSPASFTLRGNCYYSSGAFRIAWTSTTYTTYVSWRAATGQETSGGSNTGITGNPLLNGPGAGITVNNVGSGSEGWVELYNYSLQAGSSCVDTGRNLVTEFGIAHGGFDFFHFAVPRGAGYDVGANEGA